MGACQGKLPSKSSEGIARKTQGNKGDTPQPKGSKHSSEQYGSPSSYIIAPEGASDGNSTAHHLPPIRTTAELEAIHLRSDTAVDGDAPREVEEVPLSAEELVERYRKQSNALLDTVDHIKQLVKKGQLKKQRKKQAKADAKALDRANLEAHVTASEELQPQTPSLDAVEHSSSSNASAYSDATSYASCLSRMSVLSNQATDHARPTSRSQLLRRDPKVTEARQLFEDGKMLGAWNVLKQLCKEHSIEMDELEGHANELGFDIPELRSHCKAIEEMLAQLADDSGYSVSRDSEGLRVLYKCRHSRVHHIKMDAILPHPLERPLALAREFDLMSTWNHYVKDSSLLLAPTIWESWVYAGMWMPFPFPEIDAVATGRGYDLAEEDRSLLVSMATVEEADLPSGSQALPHKHVKRKRMIVVKGSCIRLEALPPGKDGKPRTKGTILAIVDPAIPHVPSFIINFVLGVIAPFAHRQIMHLLETQFDDPEKPFPKRLAAHPELYDRIRSAVKKGLKRHYGVESDDNVP